MGKILNIINKLLIFYCLLITPSFAQDAKQDAKEEAKQYIAFVQEFEATCVSREAVQILVKNTHPTKKIRLWLDRIHMGVGTGDRSKTDLLPAAEPEPLGCSRTLSGPQEWRVVRAMFVEN